MAHLENEIRPLARSPHSTVSQMVPCLPSSRYAPSRRSPRAELGERPIRATVTTAYNQSEAISTSPPCRDAQLRASFRVFDTSPPRGPPGAGRGERASHARNKSHISRMKFDRSHARHIQPFRKWCRANRVPYTHHPDGHPEQNSVNDAPVRLARVPTGNPGRYQRDHHAATYSCAPVARP